MTKVPTHTVDMPRQTLGLPIFKPGKLIYFSCHTSHPHGFTFLVDGRPHTSANTFFSAHEAQRAMNRLCDSYNALYNRFK